MRLAHADRELPIPTPAPGWVLIAVKAFGRNRSELHTRLGLTDGVTFPRVLGLEATAIVVACPGGEFESSQQVAAMMDGMGHKVTSPTSHGACVWRHTAATAATSQPACCRTSSM